MSDEIRARNPKWLLIASLGLNIFMFGALAGGAGQYLYSHWHETAKQPGAPRFAAEQLSAAQQQEFVETLRDARREARQYGQAAVNGRKNVLRLLAASPLDQAALDAAITSTREADVAFRTHVEQRVVEYAAALTPEERVKFAEGLQKYGSWHLPPAQRPLPDKEEK